MLANLIYLKTYRITNTTKVLITKLCTCDSMFHHILIYSITLHLYFQFIFWFSNFLTWSIPDECYFRNVLCALNWISTFYCITLGHTYLPSQKQYRRLQMYNVPPTTDNSYQIVAHWGQDILFYVQGAWHF